jgi:hypothetical protein
VAGRANLAKRNLAQLTALVKTRLRWMQYRPGLTPFCNPTVEMFSGPHLRPLLRRRGARASQFHRAKARTSPLLATM